MPKATPKQIPLNLAPEPDYSFARFEIGSCNVDAVTAVRAFPDWPAPILVLVGPHGSGKTHLATAWARDLGAITVTAETELEPSKHPMFLDDAEPFPESQLFAVMNFALNGDVPGLLITSTHHPDEWEIELPDLKSRLKNMPVATLSDPDDETLELIIRKLFDDQGREVSRELVTYLLAYQDRSVTAMRALITEMDAAASQSKSDLTKRFASRYLSQRSERDLFAVPGED